MVSRSSAQLWLPSEHRLPANRNHTDIVKFASPVDGMYQTVVKYMTEFIGMWRIRSSGRLNEYQTLIFFKPSILCWNVSCLRSIILIRKIS